MPVFRPVTSLVDRTLRAAIPHPHNSSCVIGLSRSGYLNESRRDRDVLIFERGAFVMRHQQVKLTIGVAGVAGVAVAMALMPVAPLGGTREVEPQVAHQGESQDRIATCPSASVLAHLQPRPTAPHVQPGYDKGWVVCTTTPTARTVSRSACTRRLFPAGR